ncbi:hypothetical protein DIE06_27165 [Burkholderia sp. Bp8998]|nr:hypothetical protein DIE06_27165 [Burkholderia sp. Bp8998]
MTALEQADRRASKIADVLRRLGRGPLSKKHAVVAANLLGVHWTTAISAANGTFTVASGAASAFLLTLAK